MKGDAGSNGLAQVAALIGDPSRAKMLLRLLDGKAYPASNLAYSAGVKPQTASFHLAKLVEGGLIAMERHGRHVYYRLNGTEVAQALEALSAISPPVQIRSLKQSVEMESIRQARTCYDHLAGKLGVELMSAMIHNEWLLIEGDSCQITKKGEQQFTRLGIDMPALRNKKRAFARPCLDWTERRYHLAGSLGAAVAARFLELGWIERSKGSRAVQVTEIGEEQIRNIFGI